MVIIISGASHTGKTKLAQDLLEKYKYPYLSVDHIKMGLIRSGNTELTPYSDDKELTDYLWKIVREIIKTVIVHDLTELAVLGIVILIRALLAFLIHWEMKMEKKEEDEKALNEE